MTSALDLVVLNGPRESDVVQLKPTFPLRLGRSLKGFQLIDPLVSLTHAEIAWEGDRYGSRISVLRPARSSMTSDDRQAGRLILACGYAGETMLEVRPRQQSTLLRVVGGMAALFIGFVAYDTYRRSISVEYTPKVVWYKQVNQGGGVLSNEMQVPTSFIRSAGIDHRELKIDDVTDYDDDGVDELWLSWRGGRRVVTFDDAGDWMTIGELSVQCKERAQLGRGSTRRVLPRREPRPHRAS